MIQIGKFVELVVEPWYVSELVEFDGDIRPFLRLGSRHPIQVSQQIVIQVDIGACGKAHDLADLVVVQVQFGKGRVERLAKAIYGCQLIVAEVYAHKCGAAQLCDALDEVAL